MPSAALLTSPVPIFFPLPSLPVLFHVFVVYPFVSGRYTMTIVLWQRSQTTGDPPGLYVTPLPFIVPGSVPAPFIRTPPIALKKQNIHINLRYHVNICSGYHNYFRRSRKTENREIDPDTYIYFCPTLGY